MAVKAGTGSINGTTIKDEKNIADKKNKTIDKVLQILENSRGVTISGETLANKLGVTRAAVWKAIRELRQQGYVIEAVTNKGYCLTSENDILSPQGMLPYLQQPEAVNKIHVFQTVDSTNNVLKKMITEGAPEGTLVLAEQQSKGKGRLGRSFYSPPGSGIYMSMLLKPMVDISQSVLITTAAATAVCRAIQKVTGITAQIKWVNDVYCNNKKICGILTEAITDFESGHIQHIILGIGVNCVTDPTLPEELASVVGALNLEQLSRNQLAAEIYNQTLAIHETLENREFLSEYRSRSLVLGKEIRIYQSGTAPAAITDGKQGNFKTAVAKDIGHDGELIVQYEDGTLDSLNSGEITIRLN